MQTNITAVTPEHPLSFRRTGARSGAAGLFMLKVVAVSALLPDEIGLYVEGLRFSFARIVLSVLAPVLVMRFGQAVIAGRYRLVLSDLFVVLTGFWMFLALGKMDGVQAALNHAGPLALEFCVGYLAGRFLLSDHGEALSFINFLCCAIAMVAMLGPLDTLTQRVIVHDLMRDLIGGKVNFGGGYRLGLFRAESTFEHPILFGLTSAFGLILAVSTPIRWRVFPILACSLGVFLALSAGPLQAAILGLGLLIYNRMMGGIRFRWGVAMGMAAAAFLTLFVAANHPWGVIFDRLTFDPEDAYFRLWTWQVAGDALDHSPWFGLGFVTPEFYEIPSTVDSFWLVLALTFGVPGAVFHGLTLLGATSLSTNRLWVRLTAAESRLGTGLGILIFVIIFCGFTVHFYGNVSILIPLLAGLRAHLGELGRVST
jgi:hypothetical protein